MTRAELLELLKKARKQLKKYTERSNDMEERIKYKSFHGFKGVLYDWHNDPFCGEHYQMIITNQQGEEVLHSYNAKPKTLEELQNVVLTVQKEAEMARHEEKEREKGWKQQEIIRQQQESKQKKDSLRALKKEIGKYVIRYKVGEKWKILFQNGKPLQFETLAEAKSHIEKMKQLHPDITFKPRKWIDKKIL